MCIWKVFKILLFKNTFVSNIQIHFKSIFFQDYRRYNIHLRTPNSVTYTDILLYECSSARVHILYLLLMDRCNLTDYMPGALVIIRAAAGPPTPLPPLPSFFFFFYMCIHIYHHPTQRPPPSPTASFIHLYA